MSESDHGACDCVDDECPKEKRAQTVPAYVIHLALRQVVCGLEITVEKFHDVSSLSQAAIA